MLKQMHWVAAAAAACLMVGCASAPTPPAEPAANVWTDRLAALKRALETATQGLGVTIEQTASNELHVVMPDALSFDVGRATIKRDLARVLEKIAEGLANAPHAQLLIVGHTDSTGNEALNERLSRSRADNARAHLVQAGVSEQAIRTEGRGSSDPLADNESAAGRAQNRRVDIIVSDRN